MTTHSLAILSDIHGNLPALDAVLDELARDGITDMVCLGDTVDLGPQPDECVRRLMDRGVPFVNGNHDPLNEATSGVLFDVQEWTKERLTDDVRRFLDEAPATRELALGAHRVFCAHGSPRSDIESISASTGEAELVEMLEPAAGCDAVVVGHTHLQLVRRVGAQTIVNAGSLGMPFKEEFNGRPPEIFKWAEYAVLHERDGQLQVELRRTDYRFEDLVDSFDPSFPTLESWLKTWID